jgi:hypothetical protein
MEEKMAEPTFEQNLMRMMTGTLVCVWTPPKPVEQLQVDEV